MFYTFDHFSFLISAAAPLNRSTAAAFRWEATYPHPCNVSRTLYTLLTPNPVLLYLCYPEHIRADRAARPASPLQHMYTIAFVPHRTEPCLQYLDQHSVLSEVSLLDFGLEFVPLDRDLLSLEDYTAWKRIYAHGDHTSLFRSAQALMTIQHAFGLFPRICGKGDLARRLTDLLIRQRREHLASDPTNPSLTTPSSSIDSLIIIDRSVDYATPLCTQLTYEGLVDEVVGIHNAHIQVDPVLLTGTNQQPQQSGTGLQASTSGSTSGSGSGTPLQLTSAPKKRKHRLDSSSDAIYAEIRDLNFAVVGEKLHRAAKRLNEGYEGRHAAKTVQQIRAFVGRLGGLQSEHASLRLHTGLTEKIMEYTAREEFNRMLEIQQNLVAGVDVGAQQAGIEDLINEERELYAVLRLLCLSSVVGPGIKAKNLEFVKREVLQTYGYRYLPLLLALQKVGILTRPPGSGSASASGGGGGFASVRRGLRLINDDVDERAPGDIAYVFSGYAPLSVRLVQAVAQKEAFLPHQAAAQPRAHPIVGWRGFEDQLAALPGATVDETQAPQPGAEHEPVTNTLVFFLGGVTYAEIAALRFMSSQTTSRRYVVATTHTISGDAMLRDLDPCPPAPAPAPALAL